MSSCLGRAVAPVKRVWRGLSGRCRRRTTGNNKMSTYVPVVSLEDDDDGTGMGGGVLSRLRKDVRTCEYRDVHVMWEMLSSSGNGGSSRETGEDVADVAGKKGAAATRRTRRRKPAPWGRLVAYCGGAF